MTATIVESDIDLEIIEETNTDTPPVCEAKVLQADHTYKDCENQADYSMHTKCCGLFSGYICEDCVIISGKERKTMPFQCANCSSFFFGFPCTLTRLTGR